VVLEKAGEDQLDRSCEKCRCITLSQEGKEYPTYNKRRKANWNAHILRRKYLLKHVTEEKKEVTGRRGINVRQLLDYVQGKRGY
jgi:hypothetical protein